VQATDAEEQAILTATRELCSEPHVNVSLLPASSIAEKAGTEPGLTVRVLIELSKKGQVDFRPSGGFDPKHSHVVCPGQPA
jgi:hypothetical protein